MFGRPKTPKIKPQEAQAQPPTTVSPEVAIAKQDLRERLRRRRGRIASRMTMPGLLTEKPETGRPALRDVLG